MRRMTNERAAPRKVDFYFYASDFQCGLLASIGWSTKAIARETRLTEAQVQYRIGVYERKHADTSYRMAYRNGTSPFARLVIRTLGAKESDVYRGVVRVLDRNGLYTPRKARHESVH